MDRSSRVSKSSSNDDGKELSLLLLNIFMAGYMYKRQPVQGKGKEGGGKGDGRQRKEKESNIRNHNLTYQQMTTFRESSGREQKENVFR